MSAQNSSLLPGSAESEHRTITSTEETAKELLLEAVISIVAVKKAVEAVSNNLMKTLMPLMASQLSKPKIAVKICENNTNFKNEIKILGKMDHQNVAKMLYQDSYKGILSYIVMDFADFEPLDEYIKRVSQPNNVEAVLTDLDGSLQLVRGLEHIHSKGIVYLGAMPKNIFVCRSSNQIGLKLANFELSSSVEEMGQSLFKTTITNVFENVSVETPGIGILNWQPPELIMHVFPEWLELFYGPIPPLLDFGFHTDVYMMGCLLFYWFTKGGHPFKQVDQGAGRSTFSLENQLSGNAMFLIRLPQVHFGYHLVRRMIVQDCNKRLKLDYVVHCLQHNHNLATLPDEPIIYSTPEQRDKISQTIIEILKKQLEVKEKALARAKQEVTKLKEQLRQGQSKESDYQKQIEYLEQHLEKESREIVQLKAEIDLLKDESPLLCKICASQQIDTRLHPCGHTLCAGCAERSSSTQCPFARCTVTNAEKVYFQ